MDRSEHPSFRSEEERIVITGILSSISKYVCDSSWTRWEAREVNSDPNGPQDSERDTRYTLVGGFSDERRTYTIHVEVESRITKRYNDSFDGALVDNRPERGEDNSIFD